MTKLKLKESVIAKNIILNSYNLVQLFSHHHIILVALFKSSNSKRKTEYLLLRPLWRPVMCPGLVVVNALIID